MNYSATIKIKSKNNMHLKKILEVDKDFREDVKTNYEILNDTLHINLECMNLRSLSKSTNMNMKKLKLIEEIEEMIENE